MSAQVSNFYSNLKRNSAGRSRLDDSFLANIRSINNFVKALLITTFVKTSEPVRVLDVACGKGGDFFKFKQIHKIAKYTGIDVAPLSIRDFHERVRTSDIQPDLHVLSATQPWPNSFDSNYTVMNVSFAFHYFWENDQTIRTFFENASRALRTGARVLITFPDSQNLQKKLNTDTPGRREYRVISSNHYKLVARIVYDSDITGRGYLFQLKDDTESFAVDAVEYFVDPNIFEFLCRYYKFRITYTENLFEYYKKHANHPLIQHMNVPTENLLEASDISVLSLYQVCVLEKLDSTNISGIHNVERINVFESVQTPPTTPPGTPPVNDYDF